MWYICFFVFRSGDIHAALWTLRFWNKVPLVHFSDTVIPHYLLQILVIVANFHIQIYGLNFYVTHVHIHTSIINLHIKCFCLISRSLFCLKGKWLPVHKTLHSISSQEDPYSTAKLVRYLWVNEYFSHGMFLLSASFLA